MVRHDKNHHRSSKSQAQKGEAFVIFEAFEVIIGICVNNGTKKSDSYPDEKCKAIDSQEISPIPLRCFDLVINKCTHTG